MNCICYNPNKSLKNIHCKKLNIETCILSDSEGYGLGIMDCNTTIAMFDIKYCPECGRKLNYEKKAFE